MIQGGNRTRHDRAAGFTLIEIAIVLAVVALITAGVVALIMPILKGAKIRATSANADLIKSALQLHLARYGRLPCPAVPAALSGLEDVANCTNTLVGATQMARGVVPWVTLGLSSEQADDGYYRRFTYHVTIAATVITTSGSGARGNMAVHTADPPAFGLAPTGNQINSCMNTAAPPPGGDDNNGCNMRAVVVLLSHGENGLGAYVSSSGTALAAPTAAGELENVDADINFVNATPGASFDDSVFFWSPDDLIQPMAREGAMKNASAVSLEALRTAEAAVTNYIVNNASSTAPGSATAPGAFVPTVYAAAPKDGWQSDINYTQVSAANICATTPGDTVVFRLHSYGLDKAPDPNALTGRNDDIIVNVTVDAIKGQIIRSSKPCTP